LTTHAKATPDDIKGVIKVAIETQSDMTVVERAGRLFSGSALQYGVSMNPTCLRPKNAHFDRVLPRTAFQRAKNFVLFNILEPLLPAKSEQVTVAQN
jgi:hypothetical protein